MRDWKFASDGHGITYAYTNEGEDGISITGWNADAAKLRGQVLWVEVPEQLAGRAVVAVDGWEYLGGRRPRLLRLELPAGLRRIGKGAFARCDELFSVEVSAGPKELPDYAFECCFQLDEVTLSKGLVSIGERALAGCRSLSKVALPQGLVEIGDYAFQSDESLTFTELPRGLRTIGKRSFSGTNRGCLLEDCLTLPEGLVSIGAEALAYCGYRRVFVPESVREIGDGAFSHAYAERGEGLIEVVCPEGSFAHAWCFERDQPHGCRSWCAASHSERDDNDDVWEYSLDDAGGAFVERWHIREGAAFGEGRIEVRVPSHLGGRPVRGISPSCFPHGEASALDPYRVWTPARLVLPEGITSIAPHAFEGCGWLGAVELPKGLRSIGRRAFAGCSELAEVVLPAGLTYLGDECFSGCASLDPTSCGGVPPMA